MNATLVQHKQPFLVLFDAKIRTLSCVLLGQPLPKQAFGELHPSSRTEGRFYPDMAPILLARRHGGPRLSRWPAPHEPPAVYARIPPIEGQHWAVSSYVYLGCGTFFALFFFEARRTPDVPWVRPVADPAEPLPPPSFSSLDDRSLRLGAMVCAQKETFLRTSFRNCDGECVNIFVQFY